MKLPLDPDSLRIDTFEVTQPASLAGESDPVADEGVRSRYCSLWETCATCFTDCPCA